MRLFIKLKPYLIILIIVGLSVILGYQQIKINKLQKSANLWYDNYVMANELRMDTEDELWNIKSVMSMK